METNVEMTRLHRLTQDEAELILNHRLLSDATKQAVHELVAGMAASTKAAPIDGNVVRLFPG